ncbi:hypothetical protein [Haloquadratum walsbyi]|uniref:Uncharacterized protein n=1 Tax=Haloquadratum walsbyi J07HQW2 TaxID=1238425 RepID=U1N0R2_9EURY|nr:hypothetical protein [Haloquadratum walsbyi]ERG96404.1 MAG: hypothetical protein J07HQW2_02882 [Haloquadratum walsbyi J07HQW2]
MTSLAEAYNSGTGGPSLRRLTFGLTLFLMGSMLIVSGIGVTTTQLLYGTDPAALTAKRQLGGVLAGVGVPAVLIGIFSILPSARLTKAAAAVGTGISLMGVFLFDHAYPCQWSGAVCGAGKPDLTLLTVVTFSFGVMVTFWCLFIGVTNLRAADAESDPFGGTSGPPAGNHPDAASGGFGLFNNSRDETDATPTSDGGTEAESITSPFDPTTASASSPSPQSPDTERKSESSPPRTKRPSPTPRNSSTRTHPENEKNTWQSTDVDASLGDQYCGNCAHFEYVKTDSGIEPYCAAHDELMDDMVPCEEWVSRID